MKPCSYCGRDNEDHAAFCFECGTEFPLAKSKTPSVQSRPDLINLNEIEGAFSFEEGFSRPDWQIVTEQVEKLSHEDWNDAWRQAGRQWMERLKSELGGTYEVHESADFFLLSESDDAKDLLRFCERANDLIHERLGDAAWHHLYGKDVVLLFTEPDDYYQYISYYYGEGAHILSAGVCIQRDEYVHLAVLRESRGVKRVIAHELAHANFAHLQLPVWLDEGLTMNFEDEIVGTPREHRPTPELIDEQRAFWNDDNIQMFWSGEAFGNAETSDQAYSTARLLVTRLMSDYSKGFVDFIQSVDYGDAGDAAAVNGLGIDLGEAVSAFTSAENPRPDRQKIATYIAQFKRADDGEAKEDS